METKDILYAIGLGITFLLGVLNLIYTRVSTRRADFIKTVTSERVKWIENLRQNVSKFIGKANHFRITRDQFPQRAWDILPELEVLMYVIKLQLNPKEEPDSEIQQLIDKVPDVVTDPKRADEYTATIGRLTSLTQDLLKKEWDKVKKEAVEGQIYVTKADPKMVFRYRMALILFLFGLVFSGLTAFPLLTEIRILANWMGIADPSRYQDLTGLVHWIAYVQFGLEQTYERFPFLGYGTDWLAFGHLASAAFIVRPLFKPLDSDWVLKTGLCICAAVVPVALIAGQIRGIPLYWRLIDCSFGVLGSLPLFYCLRLSRKMRPI